MKNKHDIVIILESIIDDYYFLWECYSEYKQFKQNENNPVIDFSQSFKEAVELKYLNFYEGTNFDGDEVLINLILDDFVIEELLDWKNDSEREIRIKTSIQGISFLDELNKVI